MISIDEAFRAYGEAVGPLPDGEVPLDEARGRVLTAEARAATDLPPFPQSAMDGYALRSEDTSAADASDPTRLRLAGTVPAAPLEEVPSLGPGEAFRIFTGAHLPRGADAVLRQEEARVEGGELLVSEPVAEGRSVRPPGEDLREGASLAAAGTRLTAGHLAALAAGGAATVRVRRAPRVALLLTGDEIVAPGRPLRPGEVYDANRPLVRGWLSGRGLLVTVSHLPDDLDETRTAIEEALEEADLVLTSGGISVGDRDHVLEAAEAAGVERVFWRVAQKPGKPLLFGVRGDAALLGLPGNPGSVHACLATHVRRVLDLLEGAAEPAPRYRRGRLRSPFRLDPQREWWARCRVELDDAGQVWLAPLADQASHMLTELGEAHALARLPRGDGETPEGTEVRWVEGAGWPESGLPD